MGDTKPAVRWRQQGRGRADTCGANPSLGGGNPHPPSLAWSSWELAAVITAGLLLLYIPLCYEDFHFHVAHVYARLGYPNAQHILGQRYLQGAGVEKNEDMAMHWFRKVEKLLSVAAAHGLQEAQQLLENILKRRNLP
ncbi:uncharacterized protein [Aphelocoma coerulescens]|uniref:uncharacterized protein isoform X3 n=1 Tax=Aphelocoma coerulescens TaxID=39617 RepID=UPI003604E426